MATTALPPPTTASSSHIPDRYLFRSLSNDNQKSTTRKSKYNSNRNPASSGTPPSLRKRYKFSAAPVADQNANTNVYKFPATPTEQRSQSTGSDRYYFPPDDSTKKPEQTLTYVGSGSGLEQRAVTFIDGTSTTPDRRSSPAKTLVPDTPYLFSKSTESPRHPSATSSVQPEDPWLDQRQQPYVIFDSITDSPPTAQLKRPRTTSVSPDRHQSKRSPTRMDTVTSTNGSLSTIRRSSPTKAQNVRFDPSATQRSYLSEARERLAGKQRGRSPQAFQQSVDRLASTTTQKYLQQQILSPPIPFQPPQQPHYVSQYYAQEEDEPPIDYPLDSDDEEQMKRSHLYSRGLNTNRTHTQIMKNVNKSLIDRNYLADTNRTKQLEQNVHRYLRFIENQALQRELNHDLIRCFSSTYLDDLRREENRHHQARVNMRSYTYEDVQDIHMSAALESYKMKKAIDREKRLRSSFDGHITSSTPTSSLGAGHLSPILSPYSPIMTGSFNENIDVHSGGFEIDRRSQKSQLSTSQTPTGLRPGHGTPAPGLDLFYEIMQDRFRGVDASIAGQVSHASQYKKQPDQTTTISSKKPTDHDSDLDSRSYSSLWSDEDDEQMVVDKPDQTVSQQKQLARYWSTVNRSLLDRPSDLIADFYISKLNQGMQESVRHVENIARDKALMRQHRNREFIEESTSKLGRSLSAEHLYQVRKEHLRYKQPSNTPTSFTVEDVEDIYKPFVLENYKRKIAIELERRRRERQGQLMAGIVSPSTHASETDSFNAIKSTQPPIIEIPMHARTSHLERTRIVRTNDYDQRASDIVVPRPVVQTREISVSRARRTITDDGSSDVVHHVGIVSPPLSYSVVKRPSIQKRTTISTSTADQYEAPQVTTVYPPDFADRSQILIRQQRIQLEVAQPTSDDLIDGALSTTQQVLIQDTDYDPRLRQPVQIITSIQSEITPTRRPQAKIYTSSPQAESVRVCHADRVETDSGNYDLNMADVRPIVTLNQGEIRELNFIAQEAQRLQIPTRDYDHAMIMLSPDRTEHQHNLHRQPLLLAAANIDLIYEERNEQVTRHTEPDIQRQHTNVIMPIAEHMAKVEQDIPVFENLAAANIRQPSRNKLQEVPHDSGIVSLNTSQASEQPMIFNASRIHRLEPSDEQRLENLHEDDYYRRRIRALDLLRQVDTDPNANIQPVHQQPMELFENTTSIPTPQIEPQHTRMIDGHRIDQMQTLEHTDEPIVYESTVPNVIQHIPGRERLISSDILQDQQTSHRAEENPIQWGAIRAPPQHHPVQSQLPTVNYEQLNPLSPISHEQRDTLRLSQEPTHSFETPKRPSQRVVYNYGEEKETTMHRASSIESDKDLQTAPMHSARIEYDRHSLSSLDDITQPISHHPPLQTSRDQEQTTTALDVEPMAVREETAFENEVSYDGSLGRASFSQRIQPLNAPRTEYFEHEAREVIHPSTESSPVYPLQSPFNRTEKARQSVESYQLERLPVQHYLEVNLNTPTGSMRRVRPSQPGPYIEDIIMDSSTFTRIESPPPSRFHQGDLKYASTSSPEQPEHLPPRHLPVEYPSGRERARVVSNTDVSSSGLNKNDEVLIRDTVVQHISEDEKSTSSEEVVFEEWSEEFRCRRTDEYDQRTNQLVRSTIDETSARVKSDVIKEEYKEKNERIKGHKSYDVVKEVYRRVPAHTIDSKSSTVIAVEPPPSHLYEEIPQPPPSTISSFDRQLPVELTPREPRWSSEDIYTTEIVYDSKLARDIESSARAQRADTRFDSVSPPSSTANYDRVRPGQYPAIPSTSQATVSTVPSSNYDRISNIVTPSTHFADRRPPEREDYVSEEYHVELEQRHSDRRSPSAQRFTSTITGKQQRDETSEEEASDLYGTTGGDRGYRGSTTIISEAGQRRDSDWRNRLKQVYGPSSDEDRVDQSSRSRDAHQRVISTTRTEEERPQPPKRSASSSSFVDERRSKFEQQSGGTSPFSTTQTDRPAAGRVGELKTAFESTSTINLRDDPTRYKSPVSTSLTEQRRRLFEEQDQFARRSSDEFNANERRMSETHTAPSSVTDRISRLESTETKSTSRVQPADRLGRTGFDAIRTSLESSIAKPVESTSPPQAPSAADRSKDKRTISSIDSDLSGSSPPIYQSTPKSTKQKREEDLGDESEDELTDPATKQDQSFESRRRTSKTRLRDFSQSTSQPTDLSYLSQRTKSSFNETNMENILSHVPTSKGKGLLIELSPHLSHETPITSTTTATTKPPHRSIIGSDSGIFEYSTATSLHPPTNSSSWRNNASSSILDDGHRTPTTRDSGVYLDSATTASSRYGRRLASDTDQTTIHGGDDSVSRSTFKYDTEIIPTDQLNQPAQTRNIRRQITGSPPSDYENIANYHSGVSSQRKVPITTQSRSILPKPLIVDEIETIETETHVECQVQRTHEIKESTKTERASSPGGPKRVVTTTTTTTTTTAAPALRSPESSSDENTRGTPSAKRVLLNERPQYYDTTKSIRTLPDSAYTPTNEIRQQTQTYRESGIQQHRFDSPRSDSLSYPSPPAHVPITSTISHENDLIRVEETGFKPIQRDRSHDSLLQSPTSRSSHRALSAGPRSVEVTSLSPQNQVTFGKYSPSEVIAIVRVPELSRSPTTRQSPPSTIRHGASEPEIYSRAKQEEEQQQRSRLHYQRVHAASYRPPPQAPVADDYQQRQGRSRLGPYETANEYPSPLGQHTRSSSYHSALHEQGRQQQQQQQQAFDSHPYSPSPTSTHRRQVQRRSGSLGNLLGSNIEFEIEIEKRPPQTPEQPTIVALDQPTRAIVTTSKDGRVSIQNIAARPGSTVVINSDFHSSDRSLNRSSGYFSSDELRSQGITTNYSSDEQSSAFGVHHPNVHAHATQPRRYRNNDPTISRLPAHYRPKPSNYQQLNNESFDQVNQLVHRYQQQSRGSTGFNDTIDQIDALYNNLSVPANEDQHSDRFSSQQENNHSPPAAYDFSRTPSAINHRRNHSQNPTEYSKRYSSTGFQHMQSQYDPQAASATSNATLRHLVSPPGAASSEQKRHRETHRAFSDNENLNPNEHQQRNWGSSSLTDLVAATPIRPSQSLSSSGILADYGTPGSISPNSGFGSTHNVVLQQNRLNSQQQIVQRNRTSVKQMKQKSAAKKKSGSQQGQYSDEEDDNDSAGGHDSPLSDSGRPQPPARFSSRHQ